MIYVEQFIVVLAISFIGEIFNYFLPFPIPGNIYGMILMFLLLISRRIKLCQVKGVSKFLIDIMPIFFIPSAVGIITTLDELKLIWWKIIIITVVTTIIVMVVSGQITQMIIRKDNRKMQR